jgi:hypothetical protein
MKYYIIEDCSPYYIRYTHDGVQDILDYCNALTPNINNLSSDFTHFRLPSEESKKMLSMIPSHNLPSLEISRVSLFISKPHMTYRAHKDGLFDRVSINYTSRILDDKCVTSWYSDEDLSIYKIDTKHYQSRECIGFDKAKHTPIKSMTAQPNEAILFNTEIFHGWDNSLSDNERVVLTLRPSLSIRRSIYFDDMKKILFDV